MGVGASGGWGGAPRWVQEQGQKSQGGRLAHLTPPASVLGLQQGLLDPLQPYLVSPHPQDRT